MINLAKDNVRRLAYLDLALPKHTVLKQRTKSKPRCCFIWLGELRMIQSLGSDINAVLAGEDLTKPDIQ
ncbi:MAG TPA: hypothetical protein VIG25_04490 [Pyrinomonadaceae bacterium]|jgi:hypothetical protein